MLFINYQLYYNHNWKNSINMPVKFIDLFKRVENATPCDYIPVVSTVTSIISLVGRCAISGTQRKLIFGDKNRKFKNLEKHSLIRRIALLFPVIGNLVIGFYDLIHREPKRDVGVGKEEGPPESGQPSQQEEVARLQAALVEAEDRLGAMSRESEAREEGYRADQQAARQERAQLREQLAAEKLRAVPKETRDMETQVEAAPVGPARSERAVQTTRSQRRIVRDAISWLEARQGEALDTVACSLEILKERAADRLREASPRSFERYRQQYYVPGSFEPYRQEALAHLKQMLQRIENGEEVAMPLYFYSVSKGEKGGFIKVIDASSGIERELSFRDERITTTMGELKTPQGYRCTDRDVSRRDGTYTVCLGKVVEKIDDVQIIEARDDVDGAPFHILLVNGQTELTPKNFAYIATEEGEVKELANKIRNGIPILKRETSQLLCHALKQGGLEHNFPAHWRRIPT